MPDLNKILDANNDFVAVTGIETTTQAVEQIDWLPLCTLDDSTTGRLCLPVRILGGVTVVTDTEFPAAETPADNLTNATATTRVNSLSYVFDGTAWDRLRGDSTGGAFVQGTVADNAVSTGNPLYAGGLAVTGSSYAPAYTAGDRAALAVDKDSGGLLCHTRTLTTTDEITATPKVKATTYGLTSSRTIAANSTAVEVKASAGNILKLNITNRHSAVIYVRIYNIAAASVNPASDTPIVTVAIPATDTRQVDYAVPKFFSTAISVRAVTDAAETGTTAPATLPVIEWDIA